MSGETATAPLASPNTVELSLEGQRLKVVEGAGKPPRDQEEFTSSPLGLALATCLLKAWCFFPSPLSTRLTPAGPGLSGQAAAWTQRV